MRDAPDPTTDLFRIDWNRHSAAQWQTMLDNCARPTLTQSPAYAAALTEVEGGAADYGLIRFQGKPIGMAIATQRRGLGGVANGSLYRGPLWIYDEIPGEMLKLALRRLRRRFRWWRGRPLNFHPELVDSPDGLLHFLFDPDDAHERLHVVLQLVLEPVRGFSRPTGVIVDWRERVFGRTLYFVRIEPSVPVFPGEL